MPLDQQTIRFGTYTVNLQSGELYKNGAKINLPGQSFQVLTSLLERPGDVVTRKALEEKLWPDGTVVDYEHSLNAAVKRLREALGDSAENPRFVETIPRRGYRFIYPVEGHESKRRRWVWAVGLAVLPAALILLLSLNVGNLRDRLLGRPLPGEITSIAVLPLDNLSGDPEQEYFAVGMTEALLTELGKIGALRVISRQSVMQYKGSDKPLSEIARELNVDAVIEGSAVREGKRVRITIQLIQAVPEQHLWAESYERDFTSVLGLQGEMARAIARQVRATVTPEEAVRLASARPVDSEAHTAYLKGRYFWNKARTEENLSKSVEYYEQAVDIDPNYALAYAGLADAINMYAGYVGPAKKWFPQARETALKALEIDETLAEAHTALGATSLFYDWDWAGAEREFKRALELNRGYSSAHQFYSVYLVAMGRFDEAIAEAKRAHQLDPLSLPTNLGLTARFYYAGQYDEAIKQGLRTLEIYPGAVYIHELVGASYSLKGMHEEAMAACNEMDSPRRERLRCLGKAQALAGRRNAALRTVEELKALPGGRTGEFDVYATLGDNDQAFEWLQEAYEQRAPSLIFLNVDKSFDPIRDDPRFQSLLRRMNFPE
jgi:TolB-like protein/DNA-binding winged helix-turn-helix (wHTH) protein/Tfp pilus assembly protein PilF